ncbi:MAG: PAS domain S-box protein [Candidatus Peregrinibacteria bacterium]|nr:PAS domain S-box protein [Candidatus Peregrinibacteria bacterium]
MEHQHPDRPAAAGLAKTLLLSRIKWGFPFLATFLPIALLSIYTFRIATQSVQEVVRAENLAQTSNVSQLLTQDITRSVSLARAVASIPGTLQALRERDAFSLTSRLKAIIVAYPQIDRAVVVDAQGKLESAYPTETTASGTDLSQEEWFTATQVGRKPFISGVYMRADEGKAESVLAIALPIVGGTGGVLGTLMFEYHTGQITKWLQNVKVSHGGHLLVLDHRGILVAHPSAASSGELYAGYAQLDPVQAALRGELLTAEYVDPLTHERMVATFLPLAVGRNLWVVISQQPVKQAYAELTSVKINISIAGAILTVCTLGMVVGLARMSARNNRLNRLLQEKNLQLSETASIVRSSNDAIIGLTLEGHIRTWNASAEAVYGYSAPEVLNQHIRMLFPEENRAEMETILAKTRDGETLKHFETNCAKKDGHLVPISLTVSPVKDEAGKTIGISSISRDITERKQVEQMKDDFISFVSHQLKAPVTAMRWTIESMLDGDYGTITPEMQEPLKQLETINAQNSHLITDILNVSRIDRGVIAVELKPTKLKDVAERAVRDYRVTIEKQGLTLTLEGLAQDIDVLADHDKLAEAVSNSVSNAIKHTEKGGITVRIRKEGDYGVVDVSDTGKGMSPEMLKKLFTRDQILGGSASPDKSAGLGLYIAMNFLKLQNGEITVTSEEGKGTTFTYRVPLVRYEKNLP